MIIEAYNGDPYGIQTTPGVVDATYGAITGYPVGDTLFVPNHQGYSSDFKLSVNPGGALSDKAWLHANTPPTLSFHLAHLSRVGLISGRQEKRYIYYSANYPLMDDLLAFLSSNCCHGNACLPKVAALGRRPGPARPKG